MCPPWSLAHSSRTRLDAGAWIGALRYSAGRTVVNPSVGLILSRDLAGPLGFYVGARCHLLTGGPANAATDHQTVVQVGLRLGHRP